MHIKLFISLIFVYATCCANSTNQIVYKHEKYTVDNGLASNNIDCIIQDHKGFIWIGTNNGLSRFDGYDVINYFHDEANPNSISSNNINNLFIDSKNNLWISTYYGINKYNYEYDNFTRYFLDSTGTPRPQNTGSIIEDINGNIWIATTWNGLFIYNPQSDSLIQYHSDTNSTNGLTSHYITHLFRDKDDNIWVGSRHGLFLYNYSSETFTVFHPDANKENSLLEDHISYIDQDDKGRLWIGTRSKGICLYDYYENKFTKLKSNSKYFHNSLNAGIRYISNTSDNKMWVFTRKEVYIYNEIEKSFYAPVFFSELDIIVHERDKVNCFWEDNNRNFWIGTPENGVYFVDRFKQTFKHYSKIQGLSDNVVTSIIESFDRNLFIGTRYGGLNFFNRTTNQIKQLTLCTNNKDGKRIHVIDFDLGKNNNLWVATNLGLYLYYVTTKKCENFDHIFKKTTSIPLHITAVEEDSKQNLWLGYFREGLYIYNIDNKTITKINSIPGNEDVNFPSHISYIIEHNKKIYMGSRLGLYIFNLNGELIKIYNQYDTHGVRDNFINCIHFDRKQRIWLGTNYGLTYFDEKNNNYINFTEKNGLPDNRIFGILEDLEGQFWISSNKGLFCLTPSNNLKQGLTKEKIKKYNKDDGLQSIQFKPNAVCKGRQGEFFFGGINGFNIFNPGNLKNNEFKPPIIITDLKVNNITVPIKQNVKPGKAILYKHISETKEITLKHTHKTFSFNYVALNYSSSMNNQYAFKLEGYDASGETGWNYVGKQRFANYTNIPPGTYTFMVKGSNNTGIWSENIASVKITILPPPWKTWWAYSIYIGIIGGIIFLIIRYIINMSRLREDNLKFRLFTNISHEIKTPLTLIQAPLDSMLESGKFDLDMARAMKRNTHRLFTLINQLLDFRKMEIGTMRLSIANGNITEFVQNIAKSFISLAYKRSISFHIDNSEPEINAWFDADKIEKITFNLLSNAFKYTDDRGSISIYIRTIIKNLDKPKIVDKKRSCRFLELKIIDTGIGIPSDQLSKVFDRFYRITNSKSDKKEGAGIGLSHTKDLVKIHKGEISVESSLGEGSIFKVVIPIDKEHYKSSSIYEDSKINYQFDISKDDLVLSPQEKTNAKESYPKPTNKILIIDDNRDIRIILRKQLQRLYQIIEARTGQEGIEKAIQELPDLIISDIMMPGTTGLELCEEIKKNDNTSNIPIILLTALSSTEQKVIGFETGADDYVSKPYNIHELMVRIKNLLDRQNRLKEKFKKEYLLNPKNVNTITADERWLKEIIEVIEANLVDPNLSGELIVSKSNISKTHLYRKLKTLTGQSVNEFIRVIRLKKAAQMLQKKVDNISQIAYDVGFSDPAYFTRCFKDYFHKSPSEYQKEYSDI